MIDKTSGEQGSALSRALSQACNGIRQRKIASDIGVSEQAVSKWFSGGSVKLENFAAAVAIMRADANVLLRAALEDAQAEGRMGKIKWLGPKRDDNENAAMVSNTEVNEPPAHYANKDLSKLCSIAQTLPSYALNALLQTAEAFSQAEQPYPAKKAS